MSPLPLSSAQLGVWYALKSGASSSAYNFASYETIEDLEPRLLVAALQQAVAETEALCVEFTQDATEPRQSPTRQKTWSVYRKDVSSELDPRASAEKWMHLDVARPVDLCRGPFFNFAVFKIGYREFLWYARYNHLVMDGFGASMIANRVAEVYNALIVEVSPPPCPFEALASLINEDVQYRQSKQLTSDRNFWLRALLDCPEPSSLRSRERAAGVGGFFKTRQLPPQLVTKLHALARRTSVTIPQIISAATAILIHRLTETEDLLLGQFVTARMGSTSSKTPGMMTNAVPFRLKLQSADTLDSLLSQIGKKTFTEMRHQRYQIADLRRDLRRINRPLLGPSLSVLPFQRELRFAGKKSRRTVISYGPVEDLNVHLSYDANSATDECYLDINANIELYDPKFIQLFHSRLFKLLEKMDDPTDAIGRLDILPSEEASLTLVTWNSTTHSFPADRTVHELFEEEVKRSPDRIAASFGRESLTYGELNKRADQLAAHLRAFGAGPGKLVGLHLERSLRMLESMLGVLKAGAAYVPLDPNYPYDRLAFIVNDARPTVLLTDTTIRRQFQVDDVEIVCLDNLAKSEPEFKLGIPKVRPENVAYVLYTSGSTGNPKGVQVPHRAVVNFLTAMQRTPGMLSDDRLLAVTSISFDIACLELFLPLVSGAQVTIAPSKVGNNGFRLSSLIDDSDATVMQGTPATWRLLLEAGWSGKKDLKVLCGGEAWPEELAEALAPRCASLWNMYGPTETTVWSSVAKIERGQRVLIGRPIANTSFYVLDQYQQPVPIEAPGELYIGGEGVACGYLNRPELSRERFLGDPYAVRIGGRMYRTGDRVRRHLDGRLEFLGRLDNQVKVQGYRIELGEIESMLRTHSKVRDAVVVVRDSGKGDQRLVAYVRGNTGDSVPASSLRELLKQKLPGYMIPATFVAVKTFPLTPNGKINRKALPSPEQGPPNLSDAKVLPRTKTELLLAQLWSDLLKQPQISIYDDFFDLGGNSLLLLRFSAQFGQLTGTTLPLRAIYDAPTVAQMAAIIDGHKAISNYSPLVLLRDGAKQPPVFLIHGIGGNVMELISIARAVSDEYAIYGIQAKGIDGADTPNFTVEAMAEYYLGAILETQTSGPYILAGLCFGGLVAIEMARRLHERGAQVALVALLESYPHPRYWPLRVRFRTSIRRSIKNNLDALRADSYRGLFFALSRRIAAGLSKLMKIASGSHSFIDVDVALPPGLKRVLKAGVSALTTYRPRPYPDKLVYLKCQDTTSVPNDPISIWGKLAREVEVHSVPGDHEQLISSHAEDVGKWLSGQVSASMKGRTVNSYLPDEAAGKGKLKNLPQSESISMPLGPSAFVNSIKASLANGSSSITSRKNLE